MPLILTNLTKEDLAFSAVDLYKVSVLDKSDKPIYTSPL